MEAKELAQKRALIGTLNEQELSLPFREGSLLNESFAPLTLCSTEDFEDHIIGIGEMKFSVCTEQIPYLIHGLSSLYTNNGLKFFDGNMEAFKQFASREVLDSKISVVNLDMEEPDDKPELTTQCNCESCLAARMNDMYGENQPKADNRFENLETTFKTLSPSGKVNLIAQIITNTIAKQMEEEEERDVTEIAPKPEELDIVLQSENRAKSMKNDMIDMLQQYENVLQGKKSKIEEPIPTIDDVKAHLQKYGARSANEYIESIPEPYKTEITKEILKSLR